MPTDRNTDPTLIYVMLAMAVTCCVTIAGQFFIKPAFTNIQADLALHDFEAAFEEVQHPAGSERLSLRSARGEFTGEEQGCDFFVGEVRQYDSSEEDILSAYAGQVVSGHPIQVLSLQEGQIPARLIYSLPGTLKDLAGWELPSDAGEPLYMVYLMIVDDEGDPELDCR
jgi:hypothetical protein